MSKESKLKIFLKNKDIKRWYDNVSRGAVTTADIYLRRLIAVCERFQKNPSELAKMKEDELYDLLLDFVSSEEKRGMKGSYIETSIKAVKSWLSHNRIYIRGKIKIKDARKAPTLENERVPTQDELRKIFLSSTPRDRVSCVLLAHSGLRPETLGNYKGTDGLRIKDFPEMEIIDGKVEFNRKPTLINVKSELSKSDHKYFSFLSEEGCEYLKVYIEERIRNGEAITDETDVITPKWAEKRFIRTINIGDGIRNSLRSAGFLWRPYVLRSYFDTQLLLSESKGKITHAYRQFFMGHKGDIEARYTTNKGKLPQNLIEDMREAYVRSQIFLQTIHTDDEDEETGKLNKYILRIAGVSQEDIEKLDAENMDADEVMDYLQKRLMNTINENGNRQRVVQLNEVERYIQEGWEYVNTLPEDKGIVRLPL